MIVHDFSACDATASLLAVPPQSSLPRRGVGENGLVTRITPASDLRLWENGGYFVLRQEIFDVLNEGEDLVADALPRLVAQGKLLADPLQRVLVAGRHLEGAQLPRGAAPPGAGPLDGLGSGAPGAAGWRTRSAVPVPPA